MPYIDEAYYTEEYMGIPVDADDLPRFIRRASETVDMVTKYGIKNFESQPQFIQDQVKKATAAQVEFFESLGGTEVAVTGSSNQQESIGKFAVTKATKNNSGLSRNQESVSQAVIQYLLPTGLLYGGVISHGS